SPLLFSRLCARRARRSFPTRRSSDLPMATLDISQQIPKTSDQRQMDQWQRTGVYAAGLALTDAGIAGKAELLDRTDVVAAAGNRSEEHTSELQSRENLVCRLLLEKKK